MPFGLKNAGATYQCLVNKMFVDYFGDRIEVYDDMIMKSLKEHDHLEHFRQAFSVLRRHAMKLNPAKCSFGITSVKFLGYLVTKRRIKADPRQIKSMENIQSSKFVKDFHKLIGRLTALNRFISKYLDKSHQFFNMLCKGKS